MNTRRLALAAAGILIALGAGCRKQNNGLPFPTRDVPTTKDENGWPLYEQKADGFAVALPPEWVALELNAATLNQALDQGIRTNTEFQALGDQIRQQVAAGMKFMGVDKTGVGSGFAVNVNVMKEPPDEGATLQNSIDEILGQLNGMSTIEKPIARERVTLKAGESERLRYVLAIKKPDGQTARAVIVQYVLLVGNEVYALTCTATADQVEHYLQTFEAIAQSIRPLK